MSAPAISSTASDRLVRSASWASVLAALLMIAIKGAAWLATGSLAILGALADSILDAAAALLIFAAIRYALAPADHEHRFGHGKAEAIAALFQGGLMCAVALFLLWGAARLSFEPVPIANSLWGAAALAACMIITLALVSYQRFVVRRTRSLAIESDSLHYRADFLLHFAALIGVAGAGLLALPRLDAICAALIALYIGFEAWNIVSRSFGQLMDHELPDAERSRVKAIALRHPDVRGVHDLRTRLSGRHPVIQFHIELDPAMSLLRAHDVSDAVEAALRAAMPGADILIHQDPEGLEKPTRFERS